MIKVPSSLRTRALTAKSGERQGRIRPHARHLLSYPLGEHPGGFIEITPSRYWVMLIDPTRKAPAATTPTDAEAIALMKSQVAYTGKCDVDPAQTPDGIKITIHVDAASNQGLTGKDRILYARVEGNKMIVKSPALVVGTSGVTSVVQLEYVRAE